MQYDSIDWDDGNWPKCGKHGLTKSDVENVFQRNPIIFADVAHSTFEDRFIAIDRASKTRCSFVVFTVRIQKGLTLIRPLSARLMHKKEIDYYDRQQAGKTTSTVFKR
jgi:uncharacterized protein